MSEGIELPPSQPTVDDMECGLELARKTPGCYLKTQGDCNFAARLAERERQLRDALKQLHVVLEREAATTARYDAKVAELESQQAADREELLRAWNYLALNVERYASKETGIKEEFQALCAAGYCVALQHLAYALNLPVELEDIDESSKAAKRIRSKFPLPPKPAAAEGGR